MAVQNDCITVTELNTLIKNNLEQNFRLQITIIGEISNKKFSAGNTYLTIKDKTSSINGIIWKWNKNCNSQLLTDGDEIIATGKLQVYLKQGTYSLCIDNFRKNINLGNIYLEYEQLKQKCLQNGYFDEQNKKTKPVFIQNIGILTSVDGAALQDILFVLNQKKLGINIYVHDCRVQGISCAKSIVDGIKYFEQLNLPLDILMITRGGGAFEDLIGFSSEDVLNAIHTCKYRTLSAVGHEVDHMLSDYVSDMSAPTPSIGAEIISTINNTFFELRQLFLNNIMNQNDQNISYCLEQLNQIESKLKINPLEQLKQQLNTSINMIAQRSDHIISLRLNEFMQLKQKLDQFTPQYLLSKVTKPIFLLDKNKEIIQSTDEFCNMTDRKFYMVFSDGEVTVNITKKQKGMT